MATASPKISGNKFETSKRLHVETPRYSKKFEKKTLKPKHPNNAVWISPLSNFKEKIEESRSVLLDTKHLDINATGSSIPLAINLAMVLQESLTVLIETTTSTVYNNSNDRFDGRKYASPAIKISIDLIAVKQSAS